MGYEIAEATAPTSSTTSVPKSSRRPRLGFDYPRLVAPKTASTSASTSSTARRSTSPPRRRRPGAPAHRPRSRRRLLVAFRQRAVTASTAGPSALRGAPRARNRRSSSPSAPPPSLMPLCGYELPATARSSTSSSQDVRLEPRYRRPLRQVSRWVTTLMSWNSGLWEAEALAATRALSASVSRARSPGGPRPNDGRPPRARAPVSGRLLHPAHDRRSQRCLAAGDGYAWASCRGCDAAAPHGWRSVTADELRACSSPPRMAACATSSITTPPT